MRLAFFAYTVVLFALQPLFAIYLLKRSVSQPAYRKGWRQRFAAKVPTLPQLPAGQKRIWVHAVSVGEANAVSSLVRHWARVYPLHQWVFTCTTPTGMDTLQAQYSSLPGVQFAYLPYDLPYLNRRLLARFQADALWVVETELWPNLLRQAAKAGVQTALVNARVSPTTGRRLQQLGLISRPVLASLGTVLAQTDADAEVFTALGRKPDLVCGNLKFDMPLRPDLASQGKAWRATLGANPVLLFASSRDGEEAVLLDILNRSQFFKRLPKACVLIVPRHPQRFDEVFQAMAMAATKMGVAHPQRRSQLLGQAGQGNTPLFVTPRLVLGDSMGEMPAYYSAADLALLGGSWAPLGGQNLIEACAYGCPVWMGPHTFNFAKASEDAIAAGAAKRFDNLQAAIEAFLTSQTNLEVTRKLAFAYARGHRGATQGSFEQLRRALTGLGQG